MIDWRKLWTLVAFLTVLAVIHASIRAAQKAGYGDHAFVFCITLAGVMCWVLGDEDERDQIRSIGRWAAAQIRRLR